MKRRIVVRKDDIVEVACGFGYIPTKEEDTQVLRLNFIEFEEVEREG